ncbi:DUF418 domain-containing protein [Luteimonas abyssi]|uniref:DUF418 domain-containing protein n=1 Tax=Luteimonas abyssi TaxID=1247514 RepID=UPI000737B8DC|nr:DUF418 domain-containing protein [Luteimonas abyssi]
MITNTARLPALDVLRGIAILGTLATNVWVFTHPAGLLGEIDGPPPSDLAEVLLRQLSTGKFLGLLSIMFGIGLAIQQRAALAAGRPWPRSYLWRAALLFLDGALNYILVVEFDVLMGYAVAGAVVAWLLCASERAQHRWCVVLVAVHGVLLTLGALAMLALPASAHADPAAYAASLDWNPYRDGNWWEMVRHRVEHLPLFRIVEPVLILPATIALFLLGARLFRAGVFEPEGAVLRRRLILIGLLAWPVDMAIAVFAGMPWWFYTRWGTAALVALGILGLVAAFYRCRPAPGWVGRRLSEVGRTALSCYVLQNVLASIVCYGWGFDLAGRIDDTQRLPATVALYLALVPLIVLAAHLWLRWFRRGPLEALWALGGRAGRDPRAPARETA